MHLILKDTFIETHTINVRPLWCIMIAQKKTLKLTMITMVRGAKLNLVSINQIENEQVLVVVWLEQFQKTRGKCRTSIHEKCPKHHGHKEDPGLTPGSCGAVGERAQMILVWVRATGVGNASHLWRPRVQRVRPLAMRSLWHVDSRMIKKTSIGGVS